MTKNLILAILILVFTTGCNFVPSVEVSEEMPPNNIPKIEAKDEFDDGIFYFAYGSNMNTQRMNDRCGSEHFTDLGKGYLDDWQFYFYGRKYANIKPKNNSVVEGVLFVIDGDCLQSLDRVEGYPHVYQRDVVNIRQDDEKYLAEVYVVQGDNTVGVPTPQYYQIVFTGAVEHDLSVDYVNQIKELAGY
ncbi:gamma-glutamylcyclotransferase [bacterium]|jgi:gamma-glutamylcyclotransferase (GGCT)/AIG2-like uncharacterized protein YtfP|nr:gamma-glutamylcyclotransferase [bacterium]MBT4649043.1 gamma-glutamylcyclotransferase [bacterium]